MALTEHEEQAFWQFVANRRQHLVRTAYLLAGDHGHAEDFVQDALIRAHRNWRRIERADQPEVYVRRIIVNLANSWWRRALRHRTHVAWEPPDRPDERDGHAAVEREDELWRALATLPAGMRAVVVLRYYEDLSEAETAAVLGTSLGTVKSQASRGLVRMRAALSESRADLATR
ncbi:RNA polymerase, sigma-24 subunit, ECF subfamily [Catenulispora acidiphila DSM 44928]|uniref:RNA polymerase, sigma-24 subunit, ECF subfamily n=1 Tax=Catenulispora acidiphila (strain DSM 44928 / JCM 14897 / NBRC 102108 / NRRL B-24433 / ID139908) TaxID=479433 RepID=C7QGG2_CATAD|nr:SigE family RNA polymerase sigma factor [Catenulispora acidiphila]ACU73007.1 RNA polymerase, sigma-24 subunit, ECF subfamily [Catenulispora acidiphila DSM 44928]